MAADAGGLYERDFFTWTQDQAAALRRAAGDRLKPSAPIDWLHLAQEIEDMGRSDLRELGSRYEVLLLHLLRWAFQPDRRSRGWAGSVVEQRLALRRLLRQSPGLKPHREAEFAEAYTGACRRAATETGLPPEAFPERPPFPLEQAEDDAFWPGPPGGAG